MHDLHYFFALSLLACVVGAFTGSLLTLGTVERREHNAAIAAGVARYVVDPTTGGVVFRYLTPDEIVVQEARK